MLRHGPGPNDSSEENPPFVGAARGDVRRPLRRSWVTDPLGRRSAPTEGLDVDALRLPACPLDCGPLRRISRRGGASAAIFGRPRALRALARRGTLRRERGGLAEGNRHAISAFSPPARSSTRGDRGRRLADREGALGHVTPLADLPVGGWVASSQRKTRASAWALRAMLRASKGDEVGARADMALVTTADPPPARARAVFAEALLFVRSHDRAALREVLDRCRALLMRASTPTERYVARALDAMLLADGSAYRAAGDLPQRSIDPVLERWTTCFAPEALPFSACAGRLG